MLTRWLWRLLAVLTVALLGLLVVSGPVSASQSHHAATFPAYAYDHPDGSEILTGATTERGPPTPDDRDTTYVADDQSSSGASAHSDEPKSADGIGYDRPEVLAQLARPTATTAAPSFAFHCSRVAAKAVDDILPTPQVGSMKLQNLVHNLYKGTTNPNRVGNGTTMDAIRNEIATGVPTGGRMHTIKGQETLNGLNNWLRRNKDADYYDRLVAQSLADELSLVLRGAP